MQRVNAGLTLVALLSLSNPTIAGFVEQTVTNNKMGAVQVAAFDSNLGLLVGVEVGASYSGYTGSTWAPKPRYGHGHQYSGSAGAFGFGGLTSGPQLLSQTSTQYLHRHRVFGSTSTISFDGDQLNQFSSSQIFSAAGTLNSASLPNGSHSHSLNQQNWNFSTQTAFTYLPTDEVMSITINTLGNGIVLPDFDEALGTLVRADVNYNWSGQTTSLYQPFGGLTPGFHQHGYSLTSQGFYISGQTGSQISFATGSPHDFSGNSSRILTGNDLSLFENGTTVFFDGVTGIANNHNHRITPSQTSFNSQVTLYYMANEIQAVPEPSSLALLSVAIFSCFLFVARRRCLGKAVA